MNGYLKLAAGVAAAVVVAVAAWQFLPNDGFGGRDPTPRPTQPWWITGDAACGFPVTCAGELAPGTHTTGSFKPPITYTVPAGWVNVADWHERDTYFALVPDTPAARAAFVAGDTPNPFVIVTDIGLASGDCLSEGTREEGVGLSSTEVAEGLTAREGVRTTEPAAVTIGGLTGLQLDAELETGWTGTCSYLTGPAAPLVGNWEAHGDNRHRIVILDMADESNVAIILFAEHAADFEPFLESAMPIVESLEFEIGPAAS